MYWLNLFTWWLYISFILYFYKLNPFNPYPFYIIIVIRDILFILLNLNTDMKMNTTSISIFKFIMILLIHYAPLYYLYKSNKKKIDKKKKIKQQNTSMLFYIFLSIIYLIYITSNNFTILIWHFYSFF